MAAATCWSAVQILDRTLSRTIFTAVRATTACGAAEATTSNILDRDPEPAGYAFWLDALDRKLVDLPSLLAQFSESNENRVAVAELVASGVSYQPYG